jgi:hypothetical protein
VVGGFYAPSHQVEYNRDIDGGVHPDSLQYYRAEFFKQWIRMFSKYNFTYGTCGYYSGEYWLDNKTKVIIH